MAAVSLLAGCSPAPVELPGSSLSDAQFETRSVTAGGLERTYVVSAPESTEPLPVIVALHGRGDDGYGFLLGTGLSAAHAIVVAPDGIGGAWSPAPYAETTVEQEFDMLDAIVADMEENFSAKSSHVYLAGFSNGGGLATVAAARHPEKFAGVATVAAAVRTDPAELSGGKPIDYLNIHGKADIKVPYDGEERSGGDTIYGAREVVDAFVQRNGSSARTEHMAVDGMGHGWPTRGAIDVNAELLSFFGLGDR